MTARVFELSTLDVSNRIRSELMRLVRLAARNGNTAEISTPPTHAEIASKINTHREAVTRELARLAHGGIVERRGSSLFVKDVARLASLLQTA